MGPLTGGQAREGRQDPSRPAQEAGPAIFRVFLPLRAVKIQKSPDGLAPTTPPGGGRQAGVPRVPGQLGEPRGAPQASPRSRKGPGKGQQLGLYKIFPL